MTEAQAQDRWPWDDPAHEVQAGIEGVTLTGKVKLRGRDFRLGSMAGANAVAGLQFAKAQAQQLDTNDPRGSAAVWDMLRSCFLISPPCGNCETCNRDAYEDCKALDEGEWPEFSRRAMALVVPIDEIFEVLRDALEQIAARPTQEPSGSSSPDATISPRSKARSSSLPAGLPPAFREAAEAGDLIDLREQLAR